ncbi:unknown [Firmicutes bacterium CAG:552]|nr:unknown [Firmicutes bacterium CAG:552]
MSYRYNHIRNFDTFAVYFDGNCFPVLNFQVGKDAVESHLAPVRPQILSHVFDNESDFIRSYMRLIEPFNFFRRTEVYKRFQHLANQSVVRIRIKFSVRKRSGSTLAELHVTVGVQQSLFRKRLDFRYTFIDFVAPFHYYRFKSVFAKLDCAKKSGRTAAYNDNRKSRNFFCVYDNRLFTCKRFFAYLHRKHILDV